MKYIKLIPNMLTFSRIGITILLDFMIMVGLESGSTFNQIILISALTIILYGTDFLDGRLARAFRCSSKFGARTDIVADFFYIISQDLILLYYEIMNFWILLIILVEFVVFIASSAKVMRMTGVQQIWFDRIGRIAAAYYYAMAFIYWMVAQIQELKLYTSLLVTADVVCIFLTVAAIGSRLTVVVDTIGISREKM